MQKEDLSKKWIKKNLAEDKNFKKQLRKEHEETISKVGVLPDSRLYKFKKVGENLQLLSALTPQKKEQIQKNLVFKRLLEADGLARKGKVDQAVLHFKKFKKPGQAWVQLQQFKKKNPEWKQTLAEDDVQKEYFWGNILIGASAYQKQFLENKIAQVREAVVETDLQPVPAKVTQVDVDESAGDIAVEENKTILQKLQGLKEAITKDESVAQEAPAPEVEELVAPQPTSAATGTTNVEPDDDTPVTATTSAQEEPIEENLTIIASRINLAPGDKATLSVILQTSDGTKKDVTDKVKWTIGADDLTSRMAGHIEKNVFYANDDGGKAYITVQLDGLSAKKTLTILKLQ